jgi:hypothetical protein
MGREAFLGTPFWTAIDVASILALAGATLGLAHGLRAHGTRLGAGLLGAAMAVHLLGLAPLYVHERMIVVLVPLFLVLLAHGVVVLLRFLPKRGRGALGAFSFLVLGALSFFGLLRSSSFDYASEPAVQKEAGLWLRERFPQSLRLMTISPSIAFYFYDAAHQGSQVGLPWAEYPDLLAFARREEVDLLASSQWQVEAAGVPAAPQLVPEAAHPGLTYLATMGETTHRVHVFRVEPALDPPASPSDQSEP